jgi:hypothetical protein
LFFNFPQPLRFRGHFSKPSRALDYRIYLPALMEDFERRGGKIEYRRIEEGDIRPLVARFDLLVVATGKGPLGNSSPTVQNARPTPSRSGSCVSVCTPAFDNPTQ